MDISVFLKALADSDTAPIVICDTEHTIVYMNPSAIERYSKWGGAALLGRSLLDCHNEDSCRKIMDVISWFRNSADNNKVFTFHNNKENKDVYMIALRNSTGDLIGYYEKHEYRDPDTGELYRLD